MYETKSHLPIHSGVISHTIKIKGTQFLISKEKGFSPLSIEIKMGKRIVERGLDDKFNQFDLCIWINVGLKQLGCQINQHDST